MIIAFKKHLKWIVSSKWNNSGFLVLVKLVASILCTFLKETGSKDSWYTLYGRSIQRNGFVSNHVPVGFSKILLIQHYPESNN